jgi:hypothetical protein
MPRVNDNPDRNFSADDRDSDSYNDLAAKLFASRPLGLEELLDDRVRMRIGELISAATRRSSGHPRRQRSRRRT